MPTPMQIVDLMMVVRKEGVNMKRFGILLVVLAWILFSGKVHADSIFATEVVAHSSSLDGSGPYNDPDDLLGKPALYCAGWGSGTDHISIVEPAWGDGFITTFNEGDWAIVKFDHRVMDDPRNPYGLDLIAYGNAFFVGNGYVTDTTNHGAYTLTGGIFQEPLKISVSRDGENWYRYDNGPYADSLYPTNPWVWSQEKWNETGNGWTDQENDFAKPVNPELTLAQLTAGTSADAMALYDGSAGGAGFDLAESGFGWIQYIKVEGLEGFSGGEVDAFSDVAPVPIPGAVWLLGSGLLGLFGIKRRNKA
ncbi:MAG: hypothetical protein JRH05_05695 [Deltaproteobacteria bacterium]|nr:hypothetical protein [Deltaproteobacteria bacterium]